ncbi:hypothetical protein L1887_05535 [Cichorium endivia]|nr:hypothetical protein L1887_05535 [Cichorium endivia]
MRTRRPSDGVLSTEAIQAVQSLKLAARNPSKLHQVFDSKLSRLLKDDLLDAFAELQRQQHLELVVKSPLITIGGYVTRSNPIESLTPTRFKASTSCPIRAPTQRAFDEFESSFSCFNWLKKPGENPNLSVPVSGGPYFPDLWIGCFVKLVADVGVVGGVSG